MNMLLKRSRKFLNAVRSVRKIKFSFFMLKNIFESFKKKLNFKIKKHEISFEKYLT
jgi:hypothetical protein